MAEIAYYNEKDPFAAEWLRKLIAANMIAPGDVDERSIEDVIPVELAKYTQCHFFAGIGGWSNAARLAGWPDTNQFGQALVRANLSAGQAKARGLLTSGTYGLRFSILSSSADLASFLVSKLKLRLNGLGLTLYNLTWKVRTTPLGRRYLRLRASERRTNGNVYSSWLTPTATEMNHGTIAFHARRKRKAKPEAQFRLGDQCILRFGMTMLERGETTENNISWKIDPAHTRWLMGYPVEWDACAPTVTPSSRKLRRSLSAWPWNTLHDH